MKRNRKQVAPRTEAQRIHEFIMNDALAAMNEERAHLGYSRIKTPVFAIEGKNDCYKSESILNVAFGAGESTEEIQVRVRESGSSCIVSRDHQEIMKALLECVEFGNSDISLIDTHREDTSLIYVTWTNA